MIIENIGIIDILFLFFTNIPSIILWLLIVFIGGSILYGFWKVFGDLFLNPIGK